MKVAINLSNHSSTKWEENQKNALKSLAGVNDIIDVSFPNVPSAASEEDIKKIANEVLNQLNSYSFDYIMIQGEFTLTYYIVSKLLENNKIPVSATTERVAVEQNGTKISQFKFVKFRKYVK